MWYTIRSQQGTLIKGRLQGKHKLLDLKITNPIAVGDFVGYFIEKDGNATITEIVERKNAIVRKSTHKTAHSHIIAANIDLAIVMATLHTPRTSTGFIDRFLAVSESAEIPAMVLFNKVDLYNQHDREHLAALTNIYESAGYPTVGISALIGSSLDYLREIFSNKVVLICGHSGVGKSTLLNALIHTATQKTAQVSSFADKGVHTTTFAEMFENGDLKIIDTPGIKELGILHIANENLDFCFPELRKVAPQCKYHNCFHRSEPGCAVIDAVEKHHIPLSRYLSYISILDGFDNR